MYEFCGHYMLYWWLTLGNSNETLEKVHRLEQVESNTNQAG
jgi:hypothetical protein